MADIAHHDALQRVIRKRVRRYIGDIHTIMVTIALVSGTRFLDRCTVVVVLWHGISTLRQRMDDGALGFEKVGSREVTVNRER